MTIGGSDYRITNNGESAHWDLELMRTVKPRGKPEREEFGDPLYGMSLENAIKIIINHRLSRKQDEYTLKEYLESYRDCLNLLKETLKSYGIEEKSGTGD